MAKTIVGVDTPRGDLNWLPPFEQSDKESIREEVERIGAKTCLEFGPGESTQALIEIGLEKIVTCEYVPKWLAVARKRFAKHKHVYCLSFTDTFPVVVEGDCNERFDIAFVDAPKGFNPVRTIHPEAPDCSRLNTVLFALERCDVVFLHDAQRPLERATLGRLWATGLYDIQFVNSRIGMARISKRGIRQSGLNQPGTPEPRGAPARAKPKRRRNPVD